MQNFDATLNKKFQICDLDIWFAAGQQQNDIYWPVPIKQQYFFLFLHKNICCGEIRKIYNNIYGLGVGFW